MNDNEWTVRKPVDEIKAGDRFIFTEDFGGEGEIVTAAGGANNMLGTRVLSVEEFDFDLEFYGNPWLTMAPPKDPTPCCPDPDCGGDPCTFPGFAENH